MGVRLDDLLTCNKLAGGARHRFRVLGVEGRSIEPNETKSVSPSTLYSDWRNVMPFVLGATAKQS